MKLRDFLIENFGEISNVVAMDLYQEDGAEAIYSIESEDAEGKIIIQNDEIRSGDGDVIISLDIEGKIKDDEFLIYLEGLATSLIFYSGNG